MKKLLIICSVATLCLNFSVFGQKKNCNSQHVSSCKLGFSEFKGGIAPYSKLTPSTFDNWRRLIVYNKTIPEMYAIAFRASECDMIINVRNPEKLNIKYCYELNAPPELVDNFFVIMQQHLYYQYPDYTASIEYKNGKSYLIIIDKEEGILISGKVATAKDKTY